MLDFVNHHKTQSISVILDAKNSKPIDKSKYLPSSGNKTAQVQLFIQWTLYRTTFIHML